MDIEKTPKEILKKAVKSSTYCLEDLNFIAKELHPSTMGDVIFHIHALQHIFISEYARFTKIKKELDLI